MCGWIVFRTRELTEAEKAKWPGARRIWANRMPPAREEILVSDEDSVWTDCLWYDEEAGIYELESGEKLREGMAWLPYPAPHRL